MNRTNCPNCGAPLNRSHECDYCNTIVPCEAQTFSSLSITANGISIVNRIGIPYRDEKGMLHAEWMCCKTPV